MIYTVARVTLPRGASRRADFSPPPPRMLIRFAKDDAAQERERTEGLLEWGNGCAFNVVAYERRRRMVFANKNVDRRSKNNRATSFSTLTTRSIPIFFSFLRFDQARLNEVYSSPLNGRETGERVAVTRGGWWIPCHVCLLETFRVSVKVYIPFRDRSYRISRWDFKVGISGCENVKVSSLVLLGVFQSFGKGTRFVSQFNCKKEK